MAEKDEDSYITLMNLFDLIESDENFRAGMYRYGIRYAATPLFEVKPFESLLATGREVRLIKLYSESDGSLLRWRTAFGSNLSTEAHFILVIADRNPLYEPTAEEHGLVATRYDDCKLPIRH